MQQAARSRLQVRLESTIVWIPVLLALAFPLIWVRVWTAPRLSEPAHSFLTGPDQARSVQEIPRLSPVFTPEVQRWSAQIFGWARKHGLPANLIATVMQIESCGHPTVSSSAGALGLFQVMPFHFGVAEDPFDPNTNAARGLAYLSRALDLANGDQSLALAGYNGGHSVMGLSESEWPTETIRYATWGRGLMEDIASGRSSSPVLAQWLNAGGHSLCLRAAQAQTG